MKCPNCNCEIKETDLYCKNCGQELNKKSNIKIEIPNQNYKRRNSHPWLIVGILVFIILITFIGVITLAIKYDEEHPSETYEDTSENQIDRREKIKTEPIEFKNYIFKMPSEYTTSTTEDKLFVYGENNKWIAVLIEQEGKYNQILQAKDQIKTLLSNQSGSENYDMTEATTEEKEYGGKQFILTKNIKSGSYYLDVTYGKADENNIFVISITKSDGTQLLETERENIYSALATGTKGA